MSTPFSCGHAVMFNTRPVAESSLKRFQPPELQKELEVIECEKCNWFLIVKKLMPYPHGVGGPDDPPGRANR